MKFSQYIWDLYKQSNKGRKAIKSFDLKTGIDIKKHLKAYNNILFEKFKWIEDMSETAYCYNVSDSGDPPSSFDKAVQFYEDVIYFGIYENGTRIIELKDYKLMLLINTALSYSLYAYSPEYYFPNLFTFNFITLNRIADNFEIDLPSVPKKSNYKARCMYYMDLCRAFYDFRIKNNLSPPELCAFLYDFAPESIKQKEIPMPNPSQAWFIGGSLSESKKHGEVNFWQSNAETRKGDILVMYEISPISAVTSVWRAKSDGIIDPFFHYYSNTFITDEIQVPHISIDELKTDKYFSNNPLVRKNFQGVNGWQITSEDYSELLRMIKDKGGETKKLPELYRPVIKRNFSISCEKDVERELLEPFLKELGISQNNYIKQLSIHAGRGSRIYPDYALFYDDSPGYEKAKVLIEAKYLMKNNQEIEQCFKQARSYANILESSVIVLCDRDCLMVYVKDNGFDRQQYIKYYWEGLQTPDKFNEIRKIINP
jgi:hypothetical protein